MFNNFYSSKAKEFVSHCREFRSSASSDQLGGQWQSVAVGVRPEASADLHLDLRPSLSRTSSVAIVNWFSAKLNSDH